MPDVASIIAITIEPVRRVRDADGAACLDCEHVVDEASHASAPWSWRKAQWMHETTGHRMQLVRFVWTDDDGR